jgi:hypothetical protein
MDSGFSTKSKAPKDIQENQLERMALQQGQAGFPVIDGFDLEPLFSQYCAQGLPNARFVVNEEDGIARQGL